MKEEIFEPLKTAKEITLETNNKNIFDDFPTYQEFIDKKEKDIFEWAMKKANNNVSSAAEILGLPRSTFRSKLEKLSS